jgi:NADPH:quinone reductase-like Zn-dependent oxidoreductase
MVVQLAVTRGATVIATASEAKHDLLRSLGATPVTYGDGLLDRVRAAAPSGVDAAIDLIGTDEAIDVSLALVGDPRRVVSIAGYRRRDTGIFLIGGGGDPGTEIRDAARPEVARLLASGELTLPIQATYPLEDTAEAHREGLTGHTRGKLVIVP